MHGAGDVVLAAEGVDGLNVLRGKLEVEALEVALDAGGGQALGQDNVAAGGVPVEQDLSRSLAVLGGNGANGGVLELVTPGQRGVSLDLDAVLLAELDKRLALAEGVNLNLVDGGDNLGVVDEALELGSTEVGNTNGADLAETLSSFQGAPALQALLLIVRGRVDQVQVEVVKTKLLEGEAESVEGGLVAVVGVPELGADVDLLTGSASLLEPAADSTTASLLVGVAGSGVDVTVAGVKGGSDGILSLLAVGGLVDTEGDLGDLVAVVELDGSNREGVALGAGLLSDGLLDVDTTLRGGLGGDSGGSHCECLCDESRR